MTDYDRLFKILIIGDSGVGKSCLLCRFVDDKFETDFIATIGVDFRTKLMDVGSQRILLKIWDTAGQERFRTICANYYRGAHGVIVTYDITSHDSFLNVQNWITQIQKNTGERVATLLVGNKCDLPDRKVTTAEGQKLADKLGVPFLETSAKSGINVSEAFQMIAEKTLQLWGDVSPAPEADGAACFDVDDDDDDDESPEKEKKCC